MSNLPLVLSLPREFSIQQAFTKLVDWPRLLWFDSATTGLNLSRAVITQAVIASSVRTRLRRWMHRSVTLIHGLHFVAGAKCYRPGDALICHRFRLASQACGVMRPVRGWNRLEWLAQTVSTPAVSVGVYDLVIAHDQVREQSWLISWGLERHEDRFEPDASRALQRQRQVMQALDVKLRRFHGRSPVHRKRQQRFR